MRRGEMRAARDLKWRGWHCGDRVLGWFDEGAVICASCQLESESIVTRRRAGINYVATGRQGDVIEIGMETVAFGRTSLTLHCVVRNRRTKKTITAVEKIVFVLVDESGRPAPHGKTEAMIDLPQASITG